MKTPTPAQPVTNLLRTKSEGWIQRELDAAKLNAEKNRSIKDDGDERATRPHSARRRPVSKSASDLYNAESHTLSRASLLPLKNSHISPTNMKESSSNNHKLISKPRVVEEQSKGISSLQYQVQSMLGEWSFAIKHAIFQDDLGLNEDLQHTPQLLVLL